MPDKDIVTPSLRNPFELDGDERPSVGPKTVSGPYDEALREGELLRARPMTAAGPVMGMQTPILMGLSWSAPEAAPARDRVRKSPSSKQAAPLPFNIVAGMALPP